MVIVKPYPPSTPCPPPGNPAGNTTPAFEDRYIKLQPCDPESLILLIDWLSKSYMNIQFESGIVQ